MNKALSNQNIQTYREQGYLLLENFFDRSRIASAIQAIDAILTSGDIHSLAELEPQDPSVIRRIWAPTQRHVFFEEMACDAKLLDAIACLIGENIVFHYSKLNMKGPRVGSPVDWHQDFSYNPHTNTDLITCIIYLDDADKHNGCLQLIPRSHQKGLFNHYKDDYFRGKIYEENLPAHSTVIDVEAPAGSVIFLHCLTLHKSNTNQSDKPRRTFLPSYRAADSFPIYVGPHTSDHEPTTKVIRGVASKTARVEAGSWALPIAEKQFNSLYEIQEGSHLKKSQRTKSGYFGHLVENER